MSVYERGARSRAVCGCSLRSLSLNPPAAQLWRYTAPAISSTTVVDIQTRPATIADIAFARDVHHAAYREVVERQFASWDERQQDAFFQQDWNPASTEIILADGKTCGYWMVEEREGDIHLREFVLHPSCQSRGIGRRLLEQLQARATARQVPIRLGTLVRNRAVALYERMGFRAFGHTTSHVLMEWTPPGRDG